MSWARFFIKVTSRAWADMSKLVTSSSRACSLEHPSCMTELSSNSPRAQPKRLAWPCSFAALEISPYNHFHNVVENSYVHNCSSCICTTDLANCSVAPFTCLQTCTIVHWASVEERKSIPCKWCAISRCLNSKLQFAFHNQPSFRGIKFLIPQFILKFSATLLDTSGTLFWPARIRKLPLLRMMKSHTSTVSGRWSIKVEFWNGLQTIFPYT